ncbi:hypothetical protein FIV50_15160 [Microbacterium foliorum]|uniref:Uncharacterized protein n=1 Tax=Microbacterium foliorum TaxID=104336 RepID=A0A4Y5YUK8_9MICO|nr:hypothetical protein [Microbacterium foliorum]QDE36009.1 hypothetical protein FIV50_15160 [Microbacterium foliorum]
MSQTSRSEAPLQASSLPGVEIIARVRRLLVVALAAAAGYSIFMTSNKGHCPGGVAADGSFVGASGNATDTAPTCVTLSLQPSALVFVAIAVIAFAAITLVLRRAADIPSALRYLDRAAAAIAILAVTSVVISQIWFVMIPITDWDGTGTFFYPFPFGSVDLTTEPMSAG